MTREEEELTKKVEKLTLELENARLRIGVLLEDRTAYWTVVSKMLKEEAELRRELRSQARE